MTPARLREEIRATLDHYVPEWQDATLVFIPAPGMTTTEVQVAGNLKKDFSGRDEYFPAYWEPKDDADAD